MRGQRGRPGAARPGPSLRVPAPAPPPAAMTLAVFFGCTFIAFGPALGLFLFTIARDPLRIIILIAGSVPHRHRYRQGHWCQRGDRGGRQGGAGAAVAPGVAAAPVPAARWSRGTGGSGGAGTPVRGARGCGCGAGVVRAGEPVPVRVAVWA